MRPPRPPLTQARRRPASRPGRLVAAAALVALTASGCGASSGASGASASPSKSASESTSSSPASPSTSPSTGPSTTALPPAATGSPASGRLIRGSGYRFHAPQGWRDVTSSARAHGGSLGISGLDRAAGARLPVHGFASNVNVVTAPRGFPDRTLAEVTGQIRRSLRPTAPGYRVLPTRELDGAPAGHLAGLRSEVDQPYWLEQYVVSHDHRGYIISFSFSPHLAPGKRTRLVDEVLAGWQWETGSEWKNDRHG